MAARSGARQDKSAYSLSSDPSVLRALSRGAAQRLGLVKELAGCGSGQPNGEVSKGARRGPPTDTNARRLGIGSARPIAREPQRQPADAGRAEQDQRRHDRLIGFDAQEWWRLRGDVSQMPSQTIAARPSGANKT
jgi:hypothetical protein